MKKTKGSKQAQNKQIKRLLLYKIEITQNLVEFETYTQILF
jgi:hypothetical protein